MALKEKSITVALADDHQLVRSAMARLVASFASCTILFEAENGEEVQEKLKNHIIPDVLLLDISMPVLDGFDTTIWMTKHYPQVRIIALTMNTDERSIVKMMRNGAKGFLSKNTEPPELLRAIETVVVKGFYLPEEISWKFVQGIQSEANLPADPSSLNEKEKEFLTLICTEMSYDHIAKKMCIGLRTADDYRATLYEKLKVHSRMGLALYAIKNGISDAVT